MYRLAAAPLALALCLGSANFAFADISDPGVHGVSGSETQGHGDDGANISTSVQSPVGESVDTPPQDEAETTDGETTTDGTTPEQPQPTEPEPTTDGEPADGGSTDGETTGGETDEVVEPVATNGGDTTDGEPNNDDDGDPNPDPKSPVVEEPSQTDGLETTDDDGTDFITLDQFIEVSGLTLLDADSDPSDLTIIGGNSAYSAFQGTSGDVLSLSFNPEPVNPTCTWYLLLQNGNVAYQTTGSTFTVPSLEQYLTFPALPFADASTSLQQAGLTIDPDTQYSFLATDLMVICTDTDGTESTASTWVYPSVVMPTLSTPGLVVVGSSLTVYCGPGTPAGSIPQWSAGTWNGSGATITVPAVAPPESGYSYLWATCQQPPYFFAVYSQPSSIADYPHYTYAYIIAQVSLDPVDGTGSQTAILTDTNFKAIVPTFAMTAPDGYQFIGWNTAPDGSATMYQPGDTIYTAGYNMTLYAQYALLPSVIETVSAPECSTTTLPASQTYTTSPTAGDPDMLIGNTFTIPAPTLPPNYTLSGITFNGAKVQVGDQPKLVAGENGLVYTLTSATLSAASSAPVISDSAATSGNVISGDTITATAATWATAAGAVTPDSVTYQWRTSDDGVNWVNVGDSTSTAQNLTVKAGTPQGTLYQLVATGTLNCQSITLTSNSLTVLDPAKNVTVSIAADGVATIGSRLTATAVCLDAFGNDLSASAKLGYQWYEGDADGDSDELIVEGATSATFTVPPSFTSNGATETVAAGDQFYAVATCQMPGTASVTSDPSNVVTIVDNAVSTVTASVTIADHNAPSPGYTVPGNTVVASPVFTSNVQRSVSNPTSVTYVWTVTAPGGATSTVTGTDTLGAGGTYTCAGTCAQISAGPAGTRYSVVVTGTNGSASATSQPSNTVTVIDPVTKVTVTVTDSATPGAATTAEVGQALTANPVCTTLSGATVDLSDPGVVVAYQWYNGSVPISGATGPTFVVPATMGTPPATTVGADLSATATCTVPGSAPVAGKSQTVMVAQPPAPAVFIADADAPSPGYTKPGDTLIAYPYYDPDNDGDNDAIPCGSIYGGVPGNCDSDDDSTIENITYQWHLNGAAVVCPASDPGCGTGQTFKVPANASANDVYTVVAIGLGPDPVNSNTETVETQPTAPPPSQSPGAAGGVSLQVTCVDLVDGVLINQPCAPAGLPTGTLSVGQYFTIPPAPVIIGYRFVGVEYNGAPAAIGDPPLAAGVNTVAYRYTPDQRNNAQVVVTIPPANSGIEIESDGAITDITTPGSLLTAVVEMDGVPVPLADVTSYQWYIDCVAVPGATAQTFTVPAGTSSRSAIQVVAKMVNPTMPMVSNEVWVNQRGTSTCNPLRGSSVQLTRTGAGLQGLPIGLPGIAILAALAVVVGAALIRKRRPA